MALTKRGEYHFGDSQADIREELLRFSTLNEYIIQHSADAVCKCGGRIFELALDDDEGAAVRSCITCQDEHPIGDSDEYLDDAELSECSCICAAKQFEITVGVSLYTASNDVRWLYVGCRCVACGLTAVFGDWKNEYEGYQELLAKI